MTYFDPDIVLEAAGPKLNEIDIILTYTTRADFSLTSRSLQCRVRYRN